MKITSRQRFWIAFILLIPMAIQMIMMPFHWKMPGYKWIAFITTTLIMLIVAIPYWKSAWAAFKHHNANMNTLVAVGTAVAYFYSLFALVIDRDVYFESAAFIAVFVLLGDIMEEKMHHQASNALKKLLKLQVNHAEVLRDGKFVDVPLDQVRKSDLIRVRPGQKIPVDGVITKGNANIDEAMITGESIPVSKKKGDTVIGSTINLNGALEVEATKVGHETYFSQIFDLVQKAQTSHAPIQKLTDRIAEIFVPVVLILAIITFTVWFVFLNVTAVHAMLFGVAVIVIACPCALGLAIPTALMVGTDRAAKMGVLIKNGEALEKINDVRTIVFDKTGTITNGKPVITDVIGPRKQVLTVAASLENKSEHPLALAIIKQAHQEQLTFSSTNHFEVFNGKGVRAKVDSQEALIGNQQLAANWELSSKLQQQAKTLQNEAKTVVYVGLAHKIIGLIAIQDIPKADAKKALQQLKKQGIKTVMLTGDNENVASAIAHQVGIDQVIAGVLPDEKADQIKHLQQTTPGKVAFVGDGINDAPALTTADVGIAMGNGTDIAIESGEIILVHNDLQAVNRALGISKKTFTRIKFNLFWALIYNVIGIPIAAGLFIHFGLQLSPELAALAMSFSSITVVGSSLLLNFAKVKD